MSEKSKEAPSFDFNKNSKESAPRHLEEGLSQLEKYIEVLEAGNLSLDASLDLFEKGVKLIKFCNEKIHDAERRVEILTKKADGSFEKSSFTEEA